MIIMYETSRFMLFEATLILSVSLGLGTSNWKDVSVDLSSSRSSQTYEITNPLTTYILNMDSDRCNACTNCSARTAMFSVKMWFSVKGFLAKTYEVCADLTNLRTESCLNHVTCSRHNSDLRVFCHVHCASMRFDKTSCTRGTHSNKAMTLNFYGREPCKLTGSAMISLKGRQEVFHLKMMDGLCGPPGPFTVIRKEVLIMSQFKSGKFQKPCTLTLLNNFTPYCIRFLYADFPATSFTMTVSDGAGRHWRSFNSSNLPGDGKFCDLYMETATFLLKPHGKVNNHRILIKYWNEKGNFDFTLRDANDDDVEDVRLAPWLVGLIVCLAFAGPIICVCSVCKYKATQNHTNAAHNSSDSMNISSRNRYHESTSMRVFVHNTIVTTNSSSNQAGLSIGPPDYSTLLETAGTASTLAPPSGTAGEHSRDGGLPPPYPAQASPLLNGPIEDDDGPESSPPKYDSLFPSFT